jgi:hypothetical protein
MRSHLIVINKVHDILNLCHSKTRYKSEILFYCINIVKEYKMSERRGLETLLDSFVLGSTLLVF